MTELRVPPPLVFVLIDKAEDQIDYLMYVAQEHEGFANQIAQLLKFRYQAFVRDNLLNVIDQKLYDECVYHLHRILRDCYMTQCYGLRDFGVSCGPDINSPTVLEQGVILVDAMWSTHSGNELRFGVRIR